MRTRRALTFIATSAGFMALGAAACTVMSDLHLPRATAIADTGAPDADDGAPRCRATRPPPPPPKTPETMGGDDPKNDLVIAVKRFVAADTNADIGYDIDGVCTCNPDPESCVTRKGPTPTAPHCDGDGGRDNAAAELLQTMASLIGFDVIGYTNERIRIGAVGFIFRLENYNGKLDDAEVTVSAYGSLGPKVKFDDAGVEGFAPGFEDGGIDPWSINRAELTDEATLTAKSRTTGYVSGGVVVINAVDNLEIPLITNGTTKFNGGVITGRIKQGANGQGPRLDNLQLAGRWHTTDLLTTLGRTEDPRTSKGLCEDTTFALLAKNFVCPRADVAGLATADNQGQPCSAVSIAIGFDMVPAALGPVVDQTPITEFCADAGFTCD